MDKRNPLYIVILLLSCDNRQFSFRRPARWSIPTKVNSSDSNEIHREQSRKNQKYRRGQRGKNLLMRNTHKQMGWYHPLLHFNLARDFSI
ncbi:hypothetical protein [Phaffia rhodozyma]|uniref:Uncharacterized protein n=1 Tax=Phaffia rhodozyma TaxID=264483 RepID=A0A0F7SQL0_PHARH|nr:hypothetical protein [Phaffia rhodozyma]